MLGIKQLLEIKMKKTAITAIVILLAVVSLFFVSCDDKVTAPSKYTVTVVREDGTEIDRAEVTEGEKYTLPSSDKVEGYTILSYSDGEKTGYMPGAQVVIRKAMKFTAVMEKIVVNYTLTINYGDVKCLEESYAVGTEIALPETFDTVPEGYRIVSYSDGTKTYNSNDKITVNSDIVLAVTAEKKTYTVTFNDGTSVVKTVSVKHGEKVAADDIPGDVKKDGSVFQGWKIKGTSDPFNENTVIKESITAEAVWGTSTTTYKVHFLYVDATTASSDRDVADGWYAASPSAPTVEGMKFAGWYRSGATLDKLDLLGEPFDFDGTRITEETYLYAKYILTAESFSTSWYNTSLGNVPFVIGTPSGKTGTVTGKVSMNPGNGETEVGKYSYDTESGKLIINFYDYFALMISSLQGGLTINGTGENIVLGNNYSTEDEVSVTEDAVDVAGTWKYDGGKWTERIILDEIPEGKDEGKFSFENIMYTSTSRTGVVVASIKTSGSYRITKDETGTRYVTFMEQTDTGFKAYGTVTNEYLSNIMIGYSKDRIELSGLMNDFGELTTTAPQN